MPTSMKLRRCGSPLAVIAIASCGSPSASPRVARSPAQPPSTVAAQETPPPHAHWVGGEVGFGGRATLGPRVAGGRLVLLGGRRALVGTDGAARPESAPAPELLDGLVLVPTRSGDRLIGFGSHGLYRFDDPLGAPVVVATSKEAIGWIGAGPGLVAVWRGNSLGNPLFVDPDTGAEVGRPAWPEGSIRNVIFPNLEQGVVEYWVPGLQVTTDGGRSFRRVVEVLPTGAYVFTHADRVGDEVRLTYGSYYPEIAHARLDFLTAVAAGYEVDAPEPSGTLRWVQATGIDPLGAAIKWGLRAQNGRSAIVTDDGVVARVDLAKGVVTESIDAGATPCALARGSGVALLVCSDAPPRELSIDEPLALRPATGGPAPRFRRGRSIRGERGGLLIVGQCAESDATDSICALQPDGTFASIDAGDRASWTDESVGALPDGRVAVIIDGDDRLPARVMLLDRTGAETLLPPLPLPPSKVYPLGPLQLGADGALHALIAAAELGSVFAVTQPLGNTAATAVDLHRRAGSAGEGYAVAYDDSSLVVGNEAAGHWGELRELRDVPLRWLWGPRPLWALDGTVDRYPSSLVHASENGLAVGSYYRVGWGEAAPPSAPPPLVGGIMLPSMAAGDPRPVVCTTQKQPGLANPFSEIATLFVRPEGQKAAGAGRTESNHSFYSVDQLRARLETSAPDAHAPAPTRWTVRWVDLGEPAAPVHEWAGAAAADAEWGHNIDSMATRDGSVAIAVSDDLVVLSPRAGSRIAHIDGGVHDGSLTLGDDGETVAWVPRESRRIMIWRPGDSPRQLATYGGFARTSEVRLAGLTSTSIAVVVWDVDRLWIRRIPLSNAGTPLPPDGWQTVPIDLATLPVCDPKMPAARFSSRKKVSTRIEVDGEPGLNADLTYALRVDGAAACIDGVTGELREAAGTSDAINTLAYISARLSTPSGYGFELGPLAHHRRSVRCSLR